jgi:uncharacterized protein YjdB
VNTSNVADMTVVKQDQPAQVTGTVTISVTLPDGFANGAEKAYITHTHDNRNYYYEGTIAKNNENKDVLTFENPNGFSTFAVSLANETPVTEVKLDRSILNMNVGDTGTLSATALPTYAVDRTVTWSSNNPDVAAVDQNGVVTAKKAGTATITASSNGKTATCSITVYNVYATGVTLNKTSLTLEAGESETLTAAVAPSNTTDKTVTWKSSDETVATVQGGVVTAVGAGTATITVSTTNVKTATCVVTVPAATTGDEGDDNTTPPAGNEGDNTTPPAGNEGDNTTPPAGNEGDSTTPPAGNDDKKDEGTDGTQTPEGQTPNTPAEPDTKPDTEPDTKPEPEPEDLSFTDVKDGQWFAPAVNWAAGQKIALGVSDKERVFAPNQGCTRAQVITFLWRAAGSPVVDSGTKFTDVKADAYYAQAVAWAVSKGITNGTSATTFSPDKVCTRAQVVTMLYRLGGEQVTEGTTFTDVSTSSYAYDAIVWAQAKGVAKGDGTGKFAPNQTCTRAQIAQFLYNYNNVIGF